MSNPVVWSGKIKKETRNWLNEQRERDDLPTGTPIDSLADAVKSGLLMYEKGSFYYGNDENIDRYEKKLAEMQTIINLQKAKIRGLEENKPENIVVPVKEEPQNFPENKKEDLNVGEVYRLAEIHRVTPQSLLDMALKPYKR